MKSSILLFSVLSCWVLSFNIMAQKGEMKIIEAPGLELLMEQKPNDNIKVINFWATWCKPCIIELPYFVEAQNKFPDVYFIYVSIDFAENIEKAEQLALKKGLSSNHLYLIDDVDYNSWIDKVSPEWSGAIPATLVMKDGEKYFYEKEFHEGELQKLLNRKLNK